MKNRINLNAVDGLHRRPLYDELIGMIDKPMITNYPDRKATQLRNSNWLQQLDGADYESLKQLNHNIMKDQEKTILLRHYAQANGVPLQEVRAAHHQAEAAQHQTHVPEYHDMSVSDGDPIPEHMDAENTPYQNLFDPDIIKHMQQERVLNTVQRQPVRSKTLGKIKKEHGSLGKVNTRRKEKLASDELDEEMEKVAQAEATDAELEALRKTVKKSAFAKLAKSEIQKIKTDVDAKVKKSVKFKKEDEDELSKIEKVDVSPDELRELEKTVQNVNHQRGGSSASGINNPKTKREKSSSVSPPPGKKQKVKEEPEEEKPKNKSSKLVVAKMKL